jgi:hypothetical protein
VLRRHAQIEGRCQRTVVDDERHADAELLAVAHDVGARVVETGVDADDREIVAGLLPRALEVRHLPAARFCEEPGSGGLICR